MIQKFPDLQKNDLYIAGESYGGIYVPQLVLRMDWYMQNHSGNSSVYIPNLKGFMVGNGVTHRKYDCEPAWAEMAYWFGMIDEDLHNNLAACNLTYYGF
jgi:carboxypeptidase C (cathepsin A)